MEKAMPQFYPYTLVVAMVLVLATSASDPNTIVDELPENKMPSVDAMADMLTRKDGRSLIEAAIEPFEPIPEMQLVQSEEVSDDGDTNQAEAKEINFSELGSQTRLEKQEALADANVKEDQASLLLSTDAQDLERIKGKMTFLVAKAKGQMASVKTSDAKEDRERAADAAKKAASYAKRVNRQVEKVKADQSKEKFAKKTVKRIMLLTGDSGGDSDSDDGDGGYDDDDDGDNDGDGDGDGDGDDDSDKTKAGHGAGVPDVISQQLNKEADKYKAVSDEEGQDAKQAKKKTASLLTTIQTLTEKLTTAKADLVSTTTALKRHQAKHKLTKMMYKKIVAKELHHKKTTAIEATIRKQQESLRLQNLKIANVKEQLQKSTLKKKQLQGDRANEGDRANVLSKTAGQEDSKSAVEAMANPEGGGTAPSPEMAAAVEAVSLNLHKQDLETELMPQVEALKAKLSGHALAQAIDKLVSSTVASKVDSAFSNDPKVSRSVEKAVQKVRTKMSDGGGPGSIPTPTQVQQEAVLAIEKVTDADKALDDASSKFASGTTDSMEGDEDEDEEDQLLIDLRKAMGE